MHIAHTNKLTSSPSFNESVSAGATVVDVVVVVDVVAVVWFVFGTLPKINAVALSALAHPTIPIMANETTSSHDGGFNAANEKKTQSKKRR